MVGTSVGTYMVFVLASSKLMLGHNLVPRVSFLPVPWTRGLSFALVDGKKRDPGNKVGSDKVRLYLARIFVSGNNFNERQGS